MVSEQLEERGWIAQDVMPGNCVKERWRREEFGLRAEITLTHKGEVSGHIKAVTAGKTKKSGELFLKELQSTEEAVEVLEGLIGVLSADPPLRPSLPPPGPANR